MKISYAKGFLIAFAAYFTGLLLVLATVDQIFPGQNAQATSFPLALKAHLPFVFGSALVIATFATVRRWMLTK